MGAIRFEAKWYVWFLFIVFCAVTRVNVVGDLFFVCVALLCWTPLVMSVQVRHPSVANVFHNRVLGPVQCQRHLAGEGGVVCCWVTVP